MSRLLFFFALAGLATAEARQPFWEQKRPADWTDAEIHELLTDSPWAQQGAYLASARPMREAEAEIAKRALPPEGAVPQQDSEAESDTEDEYADYFRENEGKVIVIAVALPNAKVLEDPAEQKSLEEQCTLKVGRKKFKMIGHFPPQGSDGRLRLIFPRAIGPGDKAFTLELYLPGAKPPMRWAEFRLRDLVYKGVPEF